MWSFNFHPLHVILSTLIVLYAVDSQSGQHTPAVRVHQGQHTTADISIDGHLDESAWTTAAELTAVISGSVLGWLVLDSGGCSRSNSRRK